MTNDSPHFLAFDLGAESGRAILGALDGGRLSLAEMHRFATPNGQMLGRLHWNLLSLWEELKTGLRKSCCNLSGELCGIGVDTWGVDFGLVASTGEILGNPMMYRDPSTARAMERVLARIPKRKLFDAAGIQIIQINSLFQLAAMNERDSKLIESAQTLLFMPDLFNYLLCGSRKSELSIASTSQMYDPRKGKWATEILEELGLPARLLPELVASGSVLGDLRQEVAAECGMKSATVIAPACHDTASAVAAVPASGEKFCYISSGTWSLMGVELAEPIISDKAFEYNYTNEMGVGPRVRFQKNIMGLWLVQECRRCWRSQGVDHDYAMLTEMARQSKEFTALLDPDHAPFLLPGQMVEKIDRFCASTKQRAPSGEGEYIRACLESLALTYRRTIDGLEDILGSKIEVIHIVGGGAQNELLNQMTADACGRPVAAGPVEAAAIGNVLVQAMAVGRIGSLGEAREIVRNNFNVKRYEPANTGKWDAAYDRYLEILDRG